MRQHFKTNGLCSHTTPNGKSIVGKCEKLNKKFNAGNITQEELWAYCLLLHSVKKNVFTVNGEISFDVSETTTTFRTIRIWGKDIQVSIEDYKKHCATLNF